jgi:hypothetical protein
VDVRRVSPRLIEDGAVIIDGSRISFAGYAADASRHSSIGT